MNGYQHLSVDEAYTLKTRADGREQSALEAFEREPTVHNWLELETAKLAVVKAHAYYLDRLLDEQAQLASR